MAGTPLTVSPNFASSAANGDDLLTTGFEVDFGDKIAGEEANSGGTSSPLTGFIYDGAKAVAVALVAKYLWSKIK